MIEKVREVAHRLATEIPTATSDLQPLPKLAVEELEKYAAYMIALGAEARRSVFQTSKGSVRDALQNYEGGRVRFLDFVYRVVTADETDRAELPWLLPPAQLVDIIHAGNGKLINLLQFSFKAADIGLQDSLLSEERLLLNFLRETFPLLADDWQKDDTAEVAPGPEDLDRSARRISEKESQCAAEVQRWQEAQICWEEEVHNVWGAPWAEEWCDLASRTHALQEKLLRLDVHLPSSARCNIPSVRLPATGDPAVDADAPRTSEELFDASEKLWTEWRELLQRCRADVRDPALLRELGSLVDMEVGMSDSTPPGLSSDCATSEEAGEAQCKLSEVVAEVMSLCSLARDVLLRALSSLSSAGTIDPPERHFSWSLPAHSIKVLQGQQSALAKRRLRLRAAAQHGLRVGSQRLLGLIATQCWRSLILSFHSAAARVVLTRLPGIPSVVAGEAASSVSRDEAAAMKSVLQREAAADLKVASRGEENEPPNELRLQLKSLKTEFESVQEECKNKTACLALAGEEKEKLLDQLNCPVYYAEYLTPVLQKVPLCAVGQYLGIAYVFG
eukprot:gene1024-1553_t